MSRRIPACFALAATAVALTACQDFATPSDLDRPQVIAIVTEPPVVAPGEGSSLAPVVVGPGGLLYRSPPDPDDCCDYDLEWRVVGLPGEPPRGTIVKYQLGDRAPTFYYHAPDAVAELPTAAALELRVILPDRELLASKLIAIGDLELSNPVISSILIDGLSIPNTIVATQNRPSPFPDPLLVFRGETLELGLEVSREPTDEASFSWYSTAGEIDSYRSARSEIVIGDTTGLHWIFAVMRDRGGQQVATAQVMVVE